MRTIHFTLLAAVLAASSAAAQQPDSVRADSAVADSIRLVRELERLQEETERGIPAEQARQRPENARMIPDISAIGDVLFDLSPDGSTLEDGSRAQIREIELGLQAAVDPYFRADIFLGLHEGAIDVEEAYLTALALPWGLQARLGRFHMPIGKQNTTHRPELHTIEYPYIIQRFLGEEGSKGDGVWVSKLFAPFGFYQELQLSAVNDFTAGGGEHAHGHDPDEEGARHDDDLVPSQPANRRLSGIGYAARLRNYWDLSEAANVEVSASAATQKRPQPIACEDALADEISCDALGGPTAVNARQSIVGADVTFRWRPLQQGLYRSFILQGEVMRVFNERDPRLPSLPAEVHYEGPDRNVTGAYVFARWQLTRRTYIGGRYDWLQDPDEHGDNFTAASGYFTFFPSEFSKFVVGFERRMPPEVKAENRLIVQTTFSIGPHRPHPF